MVDDQPRAPGPTRREPGAAAEAAARWVRDIVVRHDIETAWKGGMDPDYRLALTQAVIFLNDDNPLLANQDREELAEVMSTEGPNHPLWPSFANLMVEEFLQDLDEINLESSTSAPTTADYELVLFTQDEATSVTRAPEMSPRGVLMHFRDDRWLVAGLSGRPAVPGWPPDLGY